MKRLADSMVLRLFRMDPDGHSRFNIFAMFYLAIFAMSAVLTVFAVFPAATAGEEAAGRCEQGGGADEEQDKFHIFCLFDGEVTLRERRALSYWGFPR
jgi:hypothetical protein